MYRITIHSLSLTNYLNITDVIYYSKSYVKSSKKVNSGKLSYRYSLSKRIIVQVVREDNVEVLGNLDGNEISLYDYIK